MEKPSMSSRSRVRDHQGMENSPLADASSEISSVSSDPGDESELQSMTAKGIKHLCSELLELKAESDEDFHRNIFSTYPAFVRILEEVEGMKNQLRELQCQVTLHRRLVKDLIDDIYPKALSKEANEFVPAEFLIDEPSAPSEMEGHIRSLSETLDILLVENRTSEAITILEMEGENFQRLQYDENAPSDVLEQYNSTISERKAMLTLQLTLLAEDPRIAAADLQITLTGLCRLDESHLATQLLLKYYHSRIAAGIQNLQSSLSFSDEVSIRVLAKFVFSLISQAARSFAMLYGETSPYASEFIQWACEETEIFAGCFNKYVKPISELSCGSSTVVQAMQYAMSFCSLLETQRLMLRPCLVKQIRPCMEEVLQIHIDHSKKVISMFSATDAWVLGRYLVSGIVNEGGSYVFLRQQSEYCLLTSSGRKFITLLQTTVSVVTPLVSIQMEGSILRGLMDLFKEYIVILERAINGETNVTEKGSSRINLAKSLQQQVSVLANLSTLEYFFPGILRSVFRNINQSAGFQRREIDSSMQFIEEANDRLRAYFCRQWMDRMASLKNESGHAPEACTVHMGDRSMLCTMMPSLAFQVLFLELRTLNKLAEENVFEWDWLMELLRELIETIFLWISNFKHIWAHCEENLTGQNSDAYDQEQFVLDIHFLIEIAKYGGYFSNNPTILITIMNSVFLSVGLDPKRCVDNDDDWAKDAASKAIQRLIEIQKRKSLLKDEPIITFEGWHEMSDSFQDDVRSPPDDSTVLADDNVTIDEPEAATNAQTMTLNTDNSSAECIAGEALEVRVCMEEKASNENDMGDLMINKVEDGAEVELSRYKNTIREDSPRQQVQDERIGEKMNASVHLRSCDIDEKDK